MPQGKRGPQGPVSSPERHDATALLRGEVEAGRARVERRADRSVWVVSTPETQDHGPATAPPQFSHMQHVPSSAPTSEVRVDSKDASGDSTAWWRKYIA